MGTLPMFSDADVDQLMTDLAPEIGVAELRRYEDATWVLAFDDELSLSVEHDASRAVLVLTADLGKPAFGRETVAYKLLLQVATLWRETGGLRMGLDVSTEHAVQIYDVPLSEPELPRLREAFLDFMDLARQARSVLPSLGGEALAFGAHDFLLV